MWTKPEKQWKKYRKNHARSLRRTEAQKIIFYMKKIEKLLNNANPNEGSALAAPTLLDTGLGKKLDAVKWWESIDTKKSANVFYKPSLQYFKWS